MKKFLVVLIMVLAFTFIGCDNATTEDYVYQEDLSALEGNLDAQISYLETQILLLEERIDNLIAVEGINGQTVYYEKIVAEMSLTLTELETSANFNADLAPAYMYDSNGDYITFEDLGDMLKDKYFYDCTDDPDDEFTMIPYASFRYMIYSETMNINEITARIILLIEELANYEYYSLSSNGIKVMVYLNDGANTHIIDFEIPTVVLINDMFTLNYESLAGDEFESNFETRQPFDTINFTDVQSYYDNYVLAGTFDGYVLNYSE